MTDTKPDLFERARETSPQRRRGMWLWVLGVAVVAGGVLAAVLLWPDDGDSGRSEDPPYGLMGIELPNTETEVIAVLQALPAIDGRQPSFDAEFPAASYEPDQEKDWVGIGALQVGAEPLESFAPDVREAEGNTIEATALDPNSDLLWMAYTRDLETFTLGWADPDGSWLFYATGDTADFRIKLVDAFISTVGD